MSKESERYEEVTRAILFTCREQLGFKDVQPKGDIPGESGTSWEIDAICHPADTNGVILVECRRHTTRSIDQEQVGGLVFRIIDTGAEGGLMVTPIGYQEGAQLVAKAGNVTLVTLNADATEREYVLKVAEHLFVGKEARVRIVLGGSASPSVAFTAVASGGIVLGGSALVSFSGTPAARRNEGGDAVEPVDEVR